MTRCSPSRRWSSCYFLIRAAVTTQRQLTGLIYLLIGLNVFQAVNGIVQYHTGVGLGNVQMTLDRIYGTGIFNDPNDLGMTFVMAVPLLVFVLSRAGNWAILRLLAFVGLVLVLAGIYYTNSRGSLVGLGAALVAMSFLRFRNIAGTVVAVALLSVIVVAAPSRGGEMNASESSAQSRIQSWAEGWSMFKMHPITGVGFGQYTEYHVKVAHNSFVETFAELGLLGALCLVGMFYWYFKGIRLIPEANVESAPWRRALLASAIGVLTCAWFLSRQYVPIFYVLLAMGACAATIARASGIQEGTERRRQGRRVYRGVDVSWDIHGLHVYPDARDLVGMRLRSRFIEQCQRRAGEAAFRRFHKRGHFVCGDVVKTILLPVVECVVDARVEALHHGTEQDGCVAFRGTVCVDFDEDPLRPPFNSHSGVHPRLEAVRCR